MTTAIVFCSQHQGNTKKLLDAIAALGDVDLIDATKVHSADLAQYDRIGFASGIYFSKYHRSVIEFAQQNLPDEKKVFFIHTGGNPRENNNAAVKAVTDARNCECLGTYYCKGFDTYGPFKLVGGIAKGHPTEDEISACVKFYQGLK